MRLSVIIPIYNEEKYIAQCLDSVLEQDFPMSELEVILVDGMSSDNTRTIIQDYRQRQSECIIRMVDNPQRNTPTALNIGIQCSEGEFIVRLDAHVRYESNYCSTLVRRLEELDAANVGCVCKTDVFHKNSVSLAIREVMSHPLGVGNSLFRTGVSDTCEVDTVPFGCWRKSAFEKYGMFDERLIRNQDIEMNNRIRRKGGKIFLVTDTSCTYYARETYSELSKNNYENGKWNVLTPYLTNQNALSLRHYIPLLFVLSLIVPFLLSFLCHSLILVSLMSIILYGGTFSLLSLRLSVQKDLNFFLLFAAFFVLHFSYGFGSLRGILSVLFEKGEV